MQEVEKANKSLWELSLKTITLLIFDRIFGEFLACHPNAAVFEFQSQIWKAWAPVSKISFIPHSHSSSCSVFVKIRTEFNGIWPSSSQNQENLPDGVVGWKLHPAIGGRKRSYRTANLFGPIDRPLVPPDSNLNVNIYLLVTIKSAKHC